MGNNCQTLVGEDIQLRTFSCHTFATVNIYRKTERAKSKHPQNVINFTSEELQNFVSPSWFSQFWIMCTNFDTKIKTFNLKLTDMHQ